MTPTAAEFLRNLENRRRDWATRAQDMEVPVNYAQCIAWRDALSGFIEELEILLPDIENEASFGLEEGVAEAA